MAEMQTVDAPTVADVVAHNLKRIRNKRGLSVRALVERLAELGHPMPTTGINKSEYAEASRRRSLDVEDLCALALALHTSPAALLSATGPDHDVNEQIAVTSRVRMSAYTTQQWVRGHSWPHGALGLASGPAPAGEDAEAAQRRVAGQSEEYFDEEPHDAQRRRALDRRGHPAREAVKRLAALVDTSLEATDPTAHYVGARAQDRDRLMAEHLRAQAETVQKHLLLLADEVEHRGMLEAPTAS